jgi:HK97 family phage portal protein
MTAQWIGRRGGVGQVSASVMGDAANRMLSDPDHWIVRQVGGGRTKAGVSVNEHSALTLPAAFAAVRIIAGAMSQVPLVLMRKRVGAGGRTIREHATDHPLYDVLKRKPNERTTSHRWRQTTFGHAAGWGNGYSEIERNGRGEVVGVWQLLPDRTAPELEGERLIYRTTIENRQFRIPAEDVLHFSGLGWDGYRGYSPIGLARQAIGLGLAMEEFGAKFFANDAKSGGVLIHPGKLSDPAKSRVRSDFEGQSGLDNAHRIKVLEEGMKFVPTTIPPEDAQFLASQEFTVAQVARMFGVPLFLLHSHEKATSWGSGLEQMGTAFVTYTLADWAVGGEQELDAKLLSDEERRAGYYFKFVLDGFLRGDTKTRTDKYKAGIQDGWMTRNEVRELEDMNPLDGLDEPLVPLNMTTAGDAADPAAADATSSDEPPPAGDGEDS